MSRCLLILLLLGSPVPAGELWSFRHPRTVDPPPVRDASWPRQRIDHFLLARMERAGLTPAPAASRRVLIRRVAFDLVGLPPAPEEVAAFVHDERPDAYERLVERLLTSPRHGERWGRFWLDLVRYCDLPESWAGLKGQPWLYRDWVVRAFNEDLPYNELVRMQLAGDLLPGADPADRAALGFLGLSPVYWKEPKLAPAVIEGIVAEEWEERMEALGRTFLGLSLSCARCHDHKFDPVTMEDYYGLAGVLASIRQVDRPLLPSEQAALVRKARARLDPLEAQLAALRKKPATKETADQIGRLEKQIEEVRRTAPPLDAPLAVAVEDASLHVVPDGPHRTKVEYRPGEARDLAVHQRGNPSSPGPVVPRRFLTALSEGTPRPFRRGSGRLDLADALVTEGAPLSARVIVNRVWRHHLGRGLVETPSDFGTQGERPSHPELLDDLTARFIEHGWSLRWLHREIVLSAAYRQGSGHDARKEAADPDNRLLSRMSRRRLEVEAWRDAMLAVSGTLQPGVGGPSLGLDDPANRRRTLYGTVKRRELSDLLRLNDFPDPTAHCSARVPTTTPLQQLFVLNSPFLAQQADALARRLRADAPQGLEARVQRAYRLLYGRPATAAQVEAAREFLTPEGAEGWRQYCQVLLGSNEMLFVD